MYTLLEEAMVRTQIYLTERQRAELEIISRTLGKNQSELIREAIDRLIEQTGGNSRELILREAAGIWKDRTDLPDFSTIRSEWDRD
jgi:Arc/MetJ-type ribon-helix-helix transcriptional regulator